MNYTTSTRSLLETDSDCLCLPIFDDKTLCSAGINVDEQLGKYISTSIERFDISGEIGKAFTLLTDDKTFSRIILLGFGKKNENLKKNGRKEAQALAGELKNTNVKKLTIDFNQASTNDNQYSKIIIETIQAIETSLYSFDHYKSKKSSRNILSDVSFQCDEKNVHHIKRACELAQAQTSGMNTAKDLGNQPGNICTPSYLAEQALALGKSHDNISVKILEESDMEALNMGAFLSVSKGSTEQGKLIVIEYSGGKEGTSPHMLVGKGITFDSGGISLKAGPSMDEMKYDMCGAASVMGTMTAIAELQPKVNIVSLIAAAENMPAGNASKPGDIVTAASGLTIEILNTDAEGRLVLCDALTYAEQFNPASVIDIATLTGACIVALGHCTSALMGNDGDLINELLASGIDANDKAWQLPIGEDYQGQLDSPFADMQNIGGKGAGSITAACFLSKFAEKYKWAHLDIAGTAWVSGGKEKGATGRPVPLLLNYLLKQAEK